MSLLTKNDLVGLGITPGPLFSQIFKDTKSCKNMEEAIAVATAIRDGTFVKSERKTKIIDTDSVLHWCLERKKFFPSSEGNIEPSISEVRRMLEQGAITFNGRKPKADDKMEFPLWEVTFFKGAKTQCSLWWDMAVAPVGATWMIFKHKLEKGSGSNLDQWITDGTEWKSKKSVDSSEGLV